MTNFSRCGLVRELCLLQLKAARLFKLQCPWKWITGDDYLLLLHLLSAFILFVYFLFWCRCYTVTNKNPGARYIVARGLLEQFAFVCSDAVAALFLHRACTQYTAHKCALGARKAPNKPAKPDHIGLLCGFAATELSVCALMWCFHWINHKLVKFFFPLLRVPICPTPSVLPMITERFCMALQEKEESYRALVVRLVQMKCVTSWDEQIGCRIRWHKPGTTYKV